MVASSSRGGGLDGGDAEVFVALGEMGAGGGDAGFGVAGDGGVAVEDEVAVGSDAGGVDLGAGECGEEQKISEDKARRKMAMADGSAVGDEESGLAESNLLRAEHGCTSLLR